MVLFINLFEVQAGREAEFLTMFAEVEKYMREKPGYRGHRMYQAVAPGTDFRFVDQVDWESAEHFRAAHDDGFIALVSRPGWAAFPATNALYDSVELPG